MVKRFIWQDWAMVSSLIINVVARAITVAVTTSLQSLTTSANLVEANPLAQVLLGTEYGVIILGVLGVALIGAFYLSARRRVMNSPKDEGERVRLNTIVLAIFIFALMDTLNDVGVLIGTMIH